MHTNRKHSFFLWLWIFFIVEQRVSKDFTCYTLGLTSRLLCHSRRILKFELFLCFYYPTHAFNLFSRFSECSAMSHFYHCLLFTTKHSLLNFSSNWNDQGLFCSTSLIVSLFPVFIISIFFIKCLVFTHKFSCPHNGLIVSRNMEL